MHNVINDQSNSSTALCRERLASCHINNKKKTGKRKNIYTSDPILTDIVQLKITKKISIKPLTSLIHSVCNMYKETVANLQDSNLEILRLDMHLKGFESS